MDIKIIPKDKSPYWRCLSGLASEIDETEGLQIILDEILGNDLAIGGFLVYSFGKGRYPAFDRPFKFVEGNVRDINDLKRVLDITLLDDPVRLAVFHKRGIGRIKIFLICQIGDVDRDFDHLLLIELPVCGVRVSRPVVFNLVLIGKIKKVIPEMVKRKAE
jgi:hypothetical protein